MISGSILSYVIANYLNIHSSSKEFLQTVRKPRRHMRRHFDVMCLMDIVQTICNHLKTLSYIISSYVLIDAFGDVKYAGIVFS